MSIIIRNQNLDLATLAAVVLQFALVYVHNVDQSHFFVLRISLTLKKSITYLNARM
jgi:hypothetical protein